MARKGRLSTYRRPVLVNLDPANDCIPYRSDIDVKELVSVEEIMRRDQLGPNGALVRAMERLEERVEWLLERLEGADKDSYFVFDLPGQVELFSCHTSLLSIIRTLSRRNFRLAVVHLADATYCHDPMKYISVLLVTLQSMMQLECPQVNALCKIDLVESMEALPMRLEYYLNAQDLRYLCEALEEDPVGRRYGRLSRAICELIEESGLVSFIPLCVEDKECMAYLLSEVDKANGYAFGGLTPANESIFGTAMSEVGGHQIVALVKERYLLRSASVPESVTVNEGEE